MARTACVLVLVLTVLALARQQNASMAGTSPTVTQERTGQRRTAPEQAAPSPEDLTTPEVQRLIHDGLSSESALASARVNVRTDDRAIVLMGIAGSEQQHEAALRIAQSFTGGRQIVDKIKVTRNASE